MAEQAAIYQKMAQANARVVSLITPQSDRPWFGEVALWLRKPRAGSALVVSERARFLVVDEVHFDQFLAHVPDFRPYINKNHKQEASLLKGKPAVSLSDVDSTAKAIESAEAQIEKHNQQASIAFKMQSGGRLGGRQKDEMAERSLFAERWERMVTTLLYMPSESRREAMEAMATRHKTVSFRTCDYVQPAPSSARTHSAR